MISDVKRSSLGIGIPTYNRPEALCRRINEVSKLLAHVDELVICDNSDEKVGTIDDAIAGCPITRYVKNNSNIGGGANFLRVLEHSTTDYLWWRGDDDVISPDQVAAVVANITSTPRLILLSQFVNEKFVGVGVSSFIDNFHLVNTVGWLSSIVLPTNEAKKSLRWGYWGVASGWANVALVLGLFRVCPSLEFCVVPIKLKPEEFRDTGRKDGMSWAFFRTCIKQFPLVVDVLESEVLKHRFLKHWRLTQGFYLLPKMFRMRLGYMRQERITLSTISPLMAIDSPKSSVIAVCLYLMSKTPRVVYQVIFAAIWPLLSETRKKALGLDFLMNCRSFIEVYKALRKTEQEAISAGAFL